HVLQADLRLFLLPQAARAPRTRRRRSRRRLGAPPDRALAGLRALHRHPALRPSRPPRPAAAGAGPQPAPSARRDRRDRPFRDLRVLPGPALRSDHTRWIGVLVRVRARARPAPPHGPLLPPTESPVTGEAVARSEGWPPRILPPHARLSAPSDTRGRSAAAHHGWSPGLRAGALETPRESRHADPPQSAAGTQGLAAIARGDLPRPRDVPQRLAAHAAAALPGPPSPRDDRLRAAHQRRDGASFPDRGLAQFRQALERAQAGTGHSGHEAQADGNALELVASPGHQALPRPRARPGYLDAALPQGVDHAGPAHQHPPQPRPRILATPPRVNAAGRAQPLRRELTLTP